MLRRRSDGINKDADKKAVGFKGPVAARFCSEMGTSHGTTGAMQNVNKRVNMPLLNRPKRCRTIVTTKLTRTTNRIFSSSKALLEVVSRPFALEQAVLPMRLYTEA